MKLRGWEPGDTTPAQQLASRGWPSGPHPGGVGWAAAIEQLGEQAVVARAGDSLVGWAGLDPGELTMLVEPGNARATTALVEWAVEQAGEGELTVSVFAGDDVGAAVLTAHGFAPASGRRRLGFQPLVGMFRDASVGEPAPAPGYRVRAVAAGEASARVAAHRAAWYPAQLPWAQSANVVVDPAAQSRFTAEHYAAVTQTWLYDPELDLVVEAPDGELVASCLVWLDPASGCAEIEPVGVVAAHRRRGLARALCDEASNRVAARGGRQLFINTGPDERYPAPAATYLSAGFVIETRAAKYHRATP